MRERTPSADDTPKRAPPVPPREPSSADVADGRGTRVEASPIARFSFPTANSMVASTHNLGELVLGQQKHHYHHHHHHHHHHHRHNNHCHQSAVSRPGQTAQDKRSRLSNVINNLRRKVPECGRVGNSDGKNLETLEEYVMTVLNVVIKDSATEVHRVEVINAIGESQDSSFNGTRPKDDSRIIVEDGSIVDPIVNREPAEPSAVEPAVPDADKIVDREAEDGEAQSRCESPKLVAEASNETKVFNESASTTSESVEATSFTQIPHADDFSPGKDVRSICRDLLNDLLNDISHALEPNESLSDGPMRSLQCSLPLEKIAPILQSCDMAFEPTTTPPASVKSSSKPLASPTVRHLCLYCDRKFLSISLCQRHTERVHQIGGGRRSERNPRKTSQSCQYCSDKCADNLEGLFKHMITRHADKYHVCMQCNTRYSSREVLELHTRDFHEISDRPKDKPVTKDSHYAARDVLTLSTRDLAQPEKPEGDNRHEQEHRGRTDIAVAAAAASTSAKLNMFARVPPVKEFSTCNNPDFDSSFYSNVSCNIRENLLHHLDGKLQTNTSSATLSHESKVHPQHHQSYHEPTSQIQLPIDISLTAATPVDSKEYSTSDENSSEYAQKPGKFNRSRYRRVSFEKYNFPRKYDGKEQQCTSIQDLSRFDITTQLTLKKKQKIIKDKIVGRVESTSFLSSTTSETGQTDVVNDMSAGDTVIRVTKVGENVEKETMDEEKKSSGTEFSEEFSNFLGLRRWDECPADMARNQELVYAELTGEWSRPRIYICSACSSRHLTLKELEEHKTSAHPNVWCSHLEFTGDQRELYKHLFLPGRSVPTTKAKNAVLHEKICTKCSKLCATLAELHRHMLECGGDQAWLLGLFGNGKKKCKWRPFGSRSRRRRQRGMKRNISNSQSPRNNQPKDKASSGPRVRPSDRESIQKMLANLPAKRSTRRVMQNAISQARLRKVQTRSRPHSADNASSNTRLSSKTVLRNKLLKNAKSFQRKRCREDNISAAIESVINNYKSANTDRRLGESECANSEAGSSKKITKLEKNNQSLDNRSNKFVSRVKVVSKKSNLKIDTKKDALKLQSENTFDSIKGISSTSTIKNTKGSSKRLNQINTTVQTRAKLRSENGSMRKNKSVDPLMSLHASLKAKLQLRTSDGKFASNSMGFNSSKSDQTRVIKSDPGPSAITRSRLRPGLRKKSNVESKQITRVSSDSDKMPTLEPAADVCHDEQMGKSTNDLPILSLATAIQTPNSSPQESLSKQTVVKSRGRRRNNLGNKLEKQEDLKNTESKSTSREDITSEQGRDTRMRNRRSVQARGSTEDSNELSGSEGSLRELKFREDDVDSSQKTKSEQMAASEQSDKRNIAPKIVGSRQARQERRAGSLDELAQLQEVPLEVKKLLGPKDDLFTQIGITTTPKMRQNLKQLSEKPKLSSVKKGKVTGKIKNKIFSSDDNNCKNKKRVEKQQQQQQQPLIISDLTPIDKLFDINDYKCVFGIGLPRTWKDSEDEKHDNKTSTDEIASQSIAPVPTSHTDNSVLPENTTKESITSPLAAEKNIESQQELVESHSADQLTTPEYPSEKEIILPSSISNCDGGEDENNGSVTVDNVEKTIDIETRKDVITDLVSLGFEHLQQESSNSNIDSGKENSSETPINISKPKLPRPKKSRGFRRDRVVKRTLNNVIGILTEGVNIPVEAQQSVVLTVQTSVDNINLNNGVQNSCLELGDNTSVSEGGASNVMANENPSEQCIPSDATVNGGKSESASEDLQCSKLAIPVQEEAKLDSKPDTQTESTARSATSAVIAPSEEPTNDIILDLSRRKPRGKGSFLEKIVSKIAKQKDALLDGEVGSLLDHAVDELSIILDEVGPPTSDGNAKSVPTQASHNKNDNKVESELISPPAELSKSHEKIDKDSEKNLQVKTDMVIVNTLPEESVNNVEKIVENNSDKDLEVVKNTGEKSSKKRSLEATEDTKNKRKSVEKEEVDDNQFEEDICLADIMKLINSATRKSPVISEVSQEKNRNAKRKNHDKHKPNSADIDKILQSSGVEDNLQLDVIEVNKKTKRNSNKSDKKLDSRGATKRRSKKNIPESNLNTSKCQTDIKNLENSSTAVDKPINPHECSSELILTNLLTVKTPVVDDDVSSNTNLESEIKLNEDIKKPIKSNAKRNNIKKSLADEHLDLSDDEILVDETPVLPAESLMASGEGSSSQKSLISDVTEPAVMSDTQQEAMKLLTDSFKVPDITENPAPVKSRSKKKSLINEHLPLTEEKTITVNDSKTGENKNENISEVSDTKTVSSTDISENIVISKTTPTRGRRSSKRKATNVEASSIETVNATDESKKIEDNFIERRKTLKRKAKENIFLIDDLLDFVDDLDSLPVSETSEASINESLPADKLPDEVSTANEVKLPCTDVQNESEVKVSLPIEATADIPEADSALDDASSLKKRVSGNFAVVHTKSGEILIVEKKKKFTKEAAKFFCSLCSTSFTRKSSLKKHNSSQSHLLQVAKFGYDQENNEESMLLDDATLSSVDRCEVTLGEDRINEISTQVFNGPTATVEKIDEPPKVDAESSVPCVQVPLPSLEKHSIVDSKSVETPFDSQLEDDLEDELLDEEICKITENMTHDEYVLTDHVSPMPESTSTSIKEAYHGESEAQISAQKINLAAEHLELDSPESSNIQRNIQEALFNEKNLSTQREYGQEDYKAVNGSVNLNPHEKINNSQQGIMNDPKVSLDFSNITEKLRSNECMKNQKNSLIEFDSDDDDSATNMSRDIYKLLDDTELNLEIKPDAKEQSNNLPVISPVCPDNSFAVDIPQIVNVALNSPAKVAGNLNIEPDIFNDEKQVEETSIPFVEAVEKDVVTEFARKPTKRVEKAKVSRSQKRGNKLIKKNTPAESNESDDDDDDDDQADAVKCQSKGKIVKSVFGRVFTGEKADKVKEVLDDWVSRSDSECESALQTYSESWNNWKDVKKNKNEKSTPQSQSKTTLQTKKSSLTTSSIESAEIPVNSRCRQSKKRAEERISRAFEEESIPYELAYEIQKQTKLSKNYNKSLQSDEEKSDNEKSDNTDSVKALKKCKTKEINECSLDKLENNEEKDEEVHLFKRCSVSPTSKICKPDEFVFPDTNSMESIHTRVPSCPRERSSTPDMISLTTRDSENDVDEDSDIDDDDTDVVRGRLSPLYARNLSESSLDSISNSNKSKQDDNCVATQKRRSSSEFSGEKIVIRSTVSTQESEPGVVTIAPTDAIEDNALDVPQEIVEPAHKSRQGKVLNFDEELFVECCSRLKATTENELRGAKKIKLDHSEGYHSRSDQNLRTNRGRWRDVESQNSLGSLLESVNQLLGEEIYNSRHANEEDKRDRHLCGERYSPVTAVQTDFIRPENVGYEDSLDVAFEHNNKLRDKIQQRMRESENLLTMSFGNKVENVSQENRSRHHHHHHHNHHHHHHHHHRNQNHERHHDKEAENLPAFDRDSTGISTTKIESSLDGLLDKALSNLLHNNGKHDHNGSTPMNVLAELACAQVPTSTLTEVKSSREKSSRIQSSSSDRDLTGVQDTDKLSNKDLPKKMRNPIKELFERKNELNDRKYQYEKSQTLITEKQSIVLKPKKKIRRQNNDFPLIRTSNISGGMVERKKRWDDRKHDTIKDKIKDIYEFDEEESQTESEISTALSYRTKYDGNTIERTFQETESFTPKTKGALKSFHIEDKQQQPVIGPMDEFIQRKQRPRRSTDQSTKHKSKKRSKTSKKKSRNAWYENNSSDEFITDIKANDIGVGISKSQRTCSKGKQNLFAELSTSSESEYEDSELIYRSGSKITNRVRNSSSRVSPELADNYPEEHERSSIQHWIDVSSKTDSKNDHDNKKSESDMSDHPLVIDERKEINELNNSDEKGDIRSERAFELDDLYREDTSVSGSDCEDTNCVTDIVQTKKTLDVTGECAMFENDDLIPLEKALDLLDNSEDPSRVLGNSAEATATLQLKTFLVEDEVERHSQVTEAHEMTFTTDNNDSEQLGDEDEPNDVTDLPEKLLTNEKPEDKGSDNLPLHVFLSRKVQASKKRKEQQMKKLQEAEERALMESQSTRRQRKCAIGKQGLLAEISSSDEEYYVKDTARRSGDRSDHDKLRRQKRESKEKRKERNLEKKHEQIIVKEQKAIEDEILRELEMRKEYNEKDHEVNQNDRDSACEASIKKRSKRNSEDSFNADLKYKKDGSEKFNSDTENKCNKEEDKEPVSDSKKKKIDRHSFSSSSSSSSSRKKDLHTTPTKTLKKPVKSSVKSSVNSIKKSKTVHNERARSISKDDEELRTTKSWEKVEEGVGVAIGRRKRAAANHLYYWPSSSDDDDEEEFIPAPIVAEEEDDRQEQHGWIVGDSHKKMITMLAMEKQLKEKRRRSEDDFDSAKSKNKKYRHSTS